eukprot:jgi/Hompol1/6519/HPOL_005007-RA
MAAQARRDRPASPLIGPTGPLGPVDPVDPDSSALALLDAHSAGTDQGVFAFFGPEHPSRNKQHVALHSSFDDPSSRPSTAGVSVPSSSAALDAPAAPESSTVPLGTVCTSDTNPSKF